MVEVPRHLAGLASLLIQHGKVFLPENHPLRQGQSDMSVFNGVGAKLQAQQGDEYIALNMARPEGDLLLTLKVDDASNEPPDFSPPSYSCCNPRTAVCKLIQQPLGFDLHA